MGGGQAVTPSIFRKVRIMKSTVLSEVHINVYNSGNVNKNLGYGSKTKCGMLIGRNGVVLKTGFGKEITCVRCLSA